MGSAGSDLKEIMEQHSYEVETSDTITSIALSKDGRYLLGNVSLKEPHLQLFDLGNPGGGGSKKCELIRKYKGGHEQSMFVLRCAFGGVNEGFVLCGSEDATVSIWNREKGGEVIAKIGTGQASQGHTQVVNCVSWSPSDPSLFLSASDDQTVRLWGTEGMPPCEVRQHGDATKRIDLTKNSDAPHYFNSDYDDEGDDDDY